MAIIAKECPVEIAVVTWAAANRPALPMPSPSFVTVHEVGNTDPGADEDMHKQFVHGGGGENQVSFHFVVGPTKAIQLIYLNENAWHASDYYGGTGNRDSIAIETIQIGDFEGKTLPHLAWLIAELFRNPTRFKFRPDVAYQDDLPSDDARNRIKQHNYWAPDKKNCPQFIRGRGLWQPLLDGVLAELGSPQQTDYAKPVVYPYKRGDVGFADLGLAKLRKLTIELQAVRDTQPRAYAMAKAPRTGPEIKQGQRRVAIGTLAVPNGKRVEQWHVLEDHSRVPGSAFDPRLPKP